MCQFDTVVHGRSERPRGGGQGADRGRCGRERSENGGWTPLHEASREGHEAVVKALIKALVEAGEDINKTDFDGETSLSWAADQGHEVMV
ncbi:uncharacterized protein MICPUCDRAFT_54848 [Micromonas pusilla CCMP1545]|uniref:Predicted protein n=1 Tax=Micromonas pusilla (strain CCMP1545) TaxID=564608 RepID=C1NAC9_MICPC|nr:uncharacterized protein MICPUCDRAFT_54848 [Micromonas pusilla CCMP1545]EEH50863.1 predicted protein [Micromonas pusilla CCMP1545]|eukprot:XP_003064883.1 predicted protein [Micromonas pusilla CCMP1545]